MTKALLIERGGMYMTKEEFLLEKNNVSEKPDRYTYDCSCPEKSPKKRKQKAVLYKNNLGFEYCSHNPSKGIPTGINNEDLEHLEFQRRKEQYYNDHGIDWQRLIEEKKLDPFLNAIIEKGKVKRLIDHRDGKLCFSAKGIRKKDVGDIYPILGESRDIIYIFAGEADYYKGYQDQLTCTSPIFGEGTNFTKSTILLLQNFKQIIFVYDNDIAGKNGRDKNIEKIKASLPKVNIGFIDIPIEAGKDYCDYRGQFSLSDFLSLRVEYVGDKENQKLRENEVLNTPDIIEQRYKTYYLKKKENRRTGEIQVTPVLICNFIMRIEEEIYDDEMNIHWLIVFKMHEEQEIVRKIEMSGDELALMHKFSEKIAKYNTFLVNNTSKAIHNLLIQYVKKISKITTKKKTMYLGRTEGKSFIFCNALATNGNIEPLTSIVPPKGSLLIYQPKNSIREFWKDTIELFFQIYKEQAWKELGFKTGTVFVDEIVNEYGGFPLLFAIGPPKCGKSTLTELILASFGAHREIRPFNFKSTQKAFFRKAMKYRGIPLALNEYYSNTGSNKMLLSLFDREGYDRAKTSNDLETHSTEVNSTFIVMSTRNITGYESQAVISRLVTIDFEDIKKSRDTKGKIAELKKRKKSLSSFVSQALRIDTKKLISDIEKEVLSLESSSDADSRLIETHSIIKCCANAFLETVGLEDYKVSNIHNDIIAQEENTNSANAANLYISTLKAMIARNDLTNNQAAIKEDCIVFSLEETYPYIKRLINTEELPDVRTLGKLLKEIGATNKLSRELTPNKPKRIWRVNEKGDVQ